MELIKACENNDLEKVKELVLTQDINFNKSYHYTPLHYAVENDNLEMVKILVENGADINTLQSKNKYSPFYTTSGRKSYYTKRKDFVNTPLHHAYLYKKWTVAEYLVSKGAKDNIENEKQHTAKYYKKMTN